MSRRYLMLTAVVTLLIAACGAGPDPSAGGAIAIARPLAYSLTGDVELDYRVDMDMQMTTTFGDTFTALDPSIPSSMDMVMEMGFDARYRVEVGEAPGTYRVTMTMQNLEMGSGTIDMGAESFDFDDLPQSEIDGLLEAQIGEMSFVIDEQGEVLSMEVAGQTFDISGILSGTSPAGGGVGQMFGPALPGGDVQVGDTWTTTSEQSLFGMDPIVTEEVHTITGRESRNGHDTWVIKTESSTGAYTITWDDLIAMAESLGGLGEIGVGEGMAPGFEMSMRSAPSGSTLITWFDPDLGVSVAQEITMNLAMTMEMAGMPNTGGRAVSMRIDGYTHMTMELKG
ncbi:MAG: hypothetical protein U9N84_11520 [Actinomycetota bacterium]|nr:hypothetical protein [Actinomycetota bacterium]